MVKRKCQTCKKSFEIKPSEIKRGGGKYCSNKCKVPWNKGLKGYLSGENHWKFGKKFPGMGGLKRGQNIGNTNGFKKGHTPWNIGMSGGRKLKDVPITPEDKLERQKFQNTIQREVLKRDNYTCQLCGERGGKLQVDHIQSWAEYVELRFNINNCRTVCMSCHYKITFGRTMPKNIKAWGHNLKETKTYVS